MAKVISLINLKGGVAKTTSTVQIAECLSCQFEKRVLVIDLDPQTNATIALIDEPVWEQLDKNNRTLFHLFNDKIEGTHHFNLNKSIQKGVSNLNINNLHLLASSIKFIDIQDQITEIPRKTGYATGNPMEVLKNSIHDELNNYDYVLIDCPPNLGFITRNGIEISDYYLIPTIPDTLSTYGIPQIINTIHRFSTERPLKIKCLGLVMTKYSSSSEAHKRGKASLPARFEQIFKKLGITPAPIFNTIMPQANATTNAMEFSNIPRSFRDKYGYSLSGGDPLHKYVTSLTNELMQYAR